jgi:hypothetical protein
VKKFWVTPPCCQHSRRRVGYERDQLSHLREERIVVPVRDDELSDEDRPAAA